MVAGDHLDVDARLATGLHRGAHFGPRRVNHADHADDDQIALQRGGAVFGGDLLPGTIGDAEDAQAIGGHAGVGGEDALAQLVI